MAGGGGDPSPPPASNGGEFLLSLLQKKPHHHFQQNPPPQPSSRPSSAATPLQQQQQQQVLSFDPAVAAMGPTVAFSGEQWLSNSAADLWPHAFSPPHPYPPHLVGFQRMNNRLSRDQYVENSSQANNQFLGNRGGSGEDFRGLGISGVDGAGGSMIQNLLQQKPPLQPHEPKLMFGSLPCEFQNHQSLLNRNSSLDKNGVLDPRVNSNSNASNTFRLGIYDSSREQQELRGGGLGLQQHTPATQTRLPPPGFPSKPGLQDNVGREKGSFGDLSNRVVGSVSGAEYEARRFSDCRMVSSNLMAQSGLSQGRHKDHYDVVEADNGDQHQRRGRDELRNEGPLGNDRVNHEFDDLSEEIADSLLLEDESNDKSEKKKTRNARDKDFRSDPRGQRLLSQRMRNFKRMMGCRNDIYKLNAPFLTIYQSLVPPDEEKAKQRQLLTLLEKLVTKEWPDARLYVYGSCANTFGVSKSDIDICLAMNDLDVNKSDVLLKLADILQSDNLENVQALTRARVPIVKLMDPVTGISCDICINNVLAVVNTKLLRDYAQIDVRLHQLAFIVKHWAKSRGVNETYQGTLSSYAYVLMCIHFLQQRRPPILPCLQEMETTYSVTIDDIRCSFFDKVEKLHDFGSRNRESIAQLVWGFFNYWAYCHDYANDVISVRTGSIISKRAKDWTRRVGNDRHLICIEDPFETSHDLGRVVDKYSIKVLREEFERAADIMQHDPNPCASLFEPYVVS